MPLDATSNIVPFPKRHLSRRDHALIEQWGARAARLGVARVNVRDDMPANAVRPATDRIAIQFQRGVADGHFVVIQRAAGERAWTVMLLRVEPDGSMTLPIEEQTAVRQDGTLRDALNAVRPVLPDQDCDLLDYRAERAARRA
ncbi:MAG TPA: hypothetical protein VMU81_25280 [Acetobacteraceae bacterium]|jgi:predicted xylose isomerase-like sugar epimerase|nr:hypothetical protein [Acetobacteraceae bacterium]